MSNPYISELSKQVSQRFSVDLDNTKLSDWLCANTRLKSQPFSFRRYPFQRALVDDTARSAVTIKPSQVGVSEIYFRTALGLLYRNRDRTGILAFPDDDMRKRNSQTRLTPLLESTKLFEVPVGRDWVRSIALIQLGTSYLHVTGSKTGDATSTSADFVFLDELDLHDASNVALFSSRLLNSDWGITRYFSTPSYTEFGADGLYSQSDQTEYLIKCDSCNHWQFPLFEPKFAHIPGLPVGYESLLDLTTEAIENYGLDLAGSYICCERCRAKLDLGREDNRAWVAKYPSRDNLRGRRINPFSVSTRPIVSIVAELLKYKKLGFIRGFKNSVLGIAEDSSTNRIEEAAIRKALQNPLVPELDPTMPCWVGCDMGHTCSLVVGQKGRVVMAEQVPLAKIRERISELLHMYNIVGGMVDRHPESQVAADIWEISKGVIIPGEYRGDKEMNLIMVPDDDQKVQYAQINRTMHLDQVPTALRKGELEIFGYGLLAEELVLNLRNMVRVEAPETPAVWNKLNSNDHFFHAIGFMLSAMKLQPYTELKLGPTLSRLGFATADMAGYNGGIFNAGNSKWHSQQSLY